MVIASKTDFAEAYNKMWYLIEDELQLNPACSPKCERKIYKGVVDVGLPAVAEEKAIQHILACEV